MSSTLVLASASPRRRELLATLGLAFEVCPVKMDETLRPGHPAEEEAVRLAVAKARAGARSDSDLVIAADTLVAMEDAIFRKPASPEQAAAMLRAMREREHRVVTGVSVTGKALVQADRRTTWVWMRSYSDREIEDFVATGSPLDKAGAYAIQDARFRPVKRLEGCYCNVVGLPLGLLLKLLRDAGYPVSTVSQPPQCAWCPDWENAQ